MSAAVASGVTGAFCAALHDQAHDGLPEPVVEAARAVVLDGVGCLFAGFAEAPSRIGRDYVTAVAGHPEASVVGVGAKVDAADAAFANGVAVHALDFEAVGSPPAHGTASVLPAVFALAERSGATGRDVLQAFALGWDVECRLRTVGRLRPAFHPMAVYGPVASAAASALLLGLDPVGIENAVAIGASGAGGLAANGHTPVKVVHAGNAARSGVLAALQAEQGLAGARHVFERPGGYGEAFLLDAAWDRLNAGWGVEHFMSDDHVDHKPYPVQLPMLNVVDAVLDARPAGFDLAGFERLEMTVSTLVAGRPRDRPDHGHAGKFNPVFCAAVALVFGKVGIEAFSDEVVADPRIRRVMERTTVVERPSAGDHEVAVRLYGGDGVIEVARAHQRGSRWEPLSRRQRIDKLRGCLAHAGVEGITDDLVTCVEGLETAADVWRLGTLLRTQVHAGGGR